MAGNKPVPEFIPLNVAVVTVSDTRTEATDTSGLFLQEAAVGAGHRLVAKHICKDDIHKLRALVAVLIADDDVHAVLVTGGTGFTKRDNTIAAVSPLLDFHIDGFGELFRQLSFEEIGTSTLQSRAFAGMSNSTAVFCMPGSTLACRTAWTRIIGSQLDSRTRPCNFAERLLLKGSA